MQLRLNKTAKYYDCVKDMQNDKTLKVGDIAVTLGYYEINDGGGAEYKIKLNTEKYGEILNNNLIAELIIKDNVIVEQFGAYGDGEHDDTESFINAFNSSSSIECTAGKKYELGKNIIVLNKYNSYSLNLKTSQLINPTFAYNLTDDLKDWKNAYSANYFKIFNGIIGDDFIKRTAFKDCVVLSGRHYYYGKFTF